MTQRVLVLGAAGAQAGACVDYLLTVEACDLVLADRDESGLRSLADRLGGAAGRIRVVVVDLVDGDALADAVDGCDVVANFVGPFHRWGALAATAAVAAGAHYVDVCDDDSATRELLELSAPAARAGVTVLTGLGSGPGITNILAGICAGQLDEVVGVEFGWFASGHPRSAGPAAFAHLLWGFCTAFGARVDGKDVEVQPFDPAFGGIGRFPEPFGPLQLWGFPHPEATTFRHFVPGLSTSINRGTAYPVGVMDVLAAWHRLGYADPGMQQLSGLDMSASDFAVGHFLEHGQRLEAVAGDEATDASGMDIRVYGRLRDAEVKFRISAASQQTMAGETGVPAAVGAAMLLAGEIKDVGALAPECLDPAGFLARFGRRPRSAHGSKSGLRITRSDEGERNVALAELLATYRSPIQI
jgi:saccharopine dehydrogenase-like NADP-dependent oxidoreductase